jgi:hypothetical protein
MGATWVYIPEDITIRSHSYDNLSSYLMMGEPIDTKYELNLWNHSGSSEGYVCVLIDRRGKGADNIPEDM